MSLTHKHEYSLFFGSGIARWISERNLFIYLCLPCSLQEQSNSNKINGGEDEYLSMPPLAIIDLATPLVFCKLYFVSMKNLALKANNCREQFHLVKVIKQYIGPLKMEESILSETKNEKRGCINWELL